MGYVVKDDEVAILLKPVYDEDGNWTFEIKTGMSMGSAVGNNEEAGRSLMLAAINMAASLAYLQMYPDFEEELEDLRHDMLAELFPEIYAQAMAEVNEEMKYEKEGNVIKLNAWTKTQGNA
jgi:hypothetical protein